MGGWCRTSLAVPRAPGNASLSRPLAGGARSCAWHQGPCQLWAAAWEPGKPCPAWSTGLGPGKTPLDAPDKRLPLHGHLHGKCSFVLSSQTFRCTSQPSLNPLHIHPAHPLPGLSTTHLFPAGRVAEGCAWPWKREHLAPLQRGGTLNTHSKLLSLLSVMPRSPQHTLVRSAHSLHPSDSFLLSWIPCQPHASSKTTSLMSSLAESPATCHILPLLLFFFF